MTVCAVLVNNLVVPSALFKLGGVSCIVDHPKGSENDDKIDEIGTVQLKSRDWSKFATIQLVHPDLL